MLVISLLDGTDDSGSNAGSQIIQETTLRNYIQLETSGVIVTEDFPLILISQEYY